MLLCIILVPILLFLIKRFVLEKIWVKNVPEKPVFITGCDSGFGHALALKLLRHNVLTLAACLTENGENELKKKAVDLPGKLVTIRLDVTKDESVKRAFDVAQKELNGKELWGLVCNAGICCALGPDDWLTIDHYVKTMDVNTLGIIRTCHQFKPMIKRSKGRIVIMTSIAGRIVLPFGSTYSVSKFATEAYADAIRLEGKCFGFTTHIVEPGGFRTAITDLQRLFAMTDRIWADLPEQTKQEYGVSYVDQLKKNWKMMCRKVPSDISPVVEAYTNALYSRFPRDRYVVGRNAMLLYAPLSYLPSWVQDRTHTALMKLMGAFCVPEAILKENVKLE